MNLFALDDFVEGKFVVLQSFSICKKFYWYMTINVLSAMRIVVERTSARMLASCNE